MEKTVRVVRVYLRVRTGTQDTER